MSVRETKTGQMIHRALYFKICPIRSFFSLKHHFPVMILVPLRGPTSSQVPSSLLSNLYALICQHYSLLFYISAPYPSKINYVTSKYPSLLAIAFFQKKKYFTFPFPSFQISHPKFGLCQITDIPPLPFATALYGFKERKEKKKQGVGRLSRK